MRVTSVARGRFVPCLAGLWLILSAPPGSAQVQVKVYRDQIGIGHVYAPTDEAAFYGLGRLQARDRPLTTMMNLTWASGRLAEFLGPQQEISNPVANLFILRDRKVRANKVPDRAQALFNSYNASPPGSEGATLAKIMMAFVAGIRDELTTERVSQLATFYAQQSGNWPYDAAAKLSVGQYTRLLERDPACWEPIAGYLFGLGAVAEGLPPDPAGSQFVQLGSNSWGVSAYGSDSGSTYVHADPHAGIPDWHMVRVKSTAEGGLDFGGYILLGTPFIIGGFSNWVSWSTHYLPGLDSIDHYEYRANVNAEPPWYIDETATACNTRPLRTEMLTVPVYGGSPDVSTQWYLDSASPNPGNSPMWAAKVDVLSGECAETHKIRVTRPVGLEDGITQHDPPWDLPRMLYRMLTATSSEDLVARAFGETLAAYPIGFAIGSDFDPTAEPPPTQGPQPAGPQGPEGSGYRTPQLIYLPFARVPCRPDDLELHNYYIAPSIPMSGTQETRKWKTTATGRIFYTIDRFPTHRAHVPNNGQSTKFIAGCNSSPQWCFGRNVPFPGVESSEGTGIVQPSYGLSAGGTFYQYPAWYLDAQQYGNWVYWLTPSTVSASFTGSYDAIGLGGTYGAMTTRQEWVIHKLRENYDPLPLPRFLTEVELRGLVTDRQDPHPYYLANLHHPTLSGNPTWFQDLLNIPNLTQDQIGLISDLKSWAEAGATLLDNSNRPAKWHLFWYYFKENSQSKLYTHPDSPHDAWGLFYNFPSYHAYRFAGLFTYVREAVKDALNATLQALQALPQNPGPGALRLGDMLYVRVPFTTTEYPSVGADETLRTIWFSGWTVQPNTPNVIPRRLAPPGSRNPMLMRMRRSTEESHAVYLMNCGIASDLDGAVLPEWSPDLYRAGIRNWAEGTLYLLPMTETELGPSAPHYDFTFSPNPSCP